MIGVLGLFLGYGIFHSNSHTHSTSVAATPVQDSPMLEPAIMNEDNKVAPKDLGIQFAQGGTVVSGGSGFSMGTSVSSNKSDYSLPDGTIRKDVVAHFAVWNKEKDFEQDYTVGPGSMFRLGENYILVVAVQDGSSGPNPGDDQSWVAYKVIPVD